VGRNHFSKAGGPYFINNGISAHKEHHKHDDSHTHPYMFEVGPLRKLFNLVKSKFKKGPL
jgi:hypothetical protein